jgi:hypothetical protein
LFISAKPNPSSYNGFDLLTNLLLTNGKDVKMKKIILMLSILAVVVLCYSCSSFYYANSITHGLAQNIYTLGSEESFILTKYTTDKPVTFSDCSKECDAIGRGQHWQARSVRVSSYNTCTCADLQWDISYQISSRNLAYLSNTSTNDDCSRLAFSSGYLEYIYYDGKCYVKNKFYSIGTDMTKIECQERANQTAPENGFVYVAKTQSCYVVENKSRYK